MDEGNLPILVDAKTEYTRQLINIITPVIYQGIKLIYNESKNKSIENEETNLCLSYFQNELSEIPKWNQIIITEKYNTIIEQSKCDWLDDLLTAVFVSHTKILTSINTSKNKNKINLQIPKVDFFIHQCYIDVAREFWKNPYLFDSNVNNFEYQRNRRDAIQIIENIISETIRKQLPVKNILKEYLGSEYSEDTNDNIKEPNKITNNLRKLVKNEIENCSKEKLSALNIQTSNKNNESNNLTNEDLKAFENTKIESLDCTLNENESEIIKPLEVFDENGNSIKINKIEDNELNIENIDNLDNLITSEVDKLELVSANDFDLNAEKIDDNINKELSDLSLLEEVYIDEKKPVSLKDESEIQKELITSQSNTKSNESNNDESNNIINTTQKSELDKELEKIDKNINENLKLEINENNELGLEELNLDSLDDLNFDINNLELDNEDNISQNNYNHDNNKIDNIKTDNIKTIIIDTKQNNTNSNSFDNDSELEINIDNNPRKKIYNRYSSKRKKDFSFFTDTLS